MEEEKLELVNIEKLKENDILKAMIESNIITKQGFRMTGMGLVLKKLDELNRLVDKTNLKLHYIEKKLEK